MLPPTAESVTPAVAPVTWILAVEAVGFEVNEVSVMEPAATVMLTAVLAVVQPVINALAPKFTLSPAESVKAPSSELTVEVILILLLAPVAVMLTVPMLVVVTGPLMLTEPAVAFKVILPAIILIDEVPDNVMPLVAVIDTAAKPDTAADTVVVEDELTVRAFAPIVTLPLNVTLPVPATTVNALPKETVLLNKIGAPTPVEICTAPTLVDIGPLKVILPAAVVRLTPLITALAKDIVPAPDNVMAPSTLVVDAVILMAVVVPVMPAMILVVELDDTVTAASVDTAPVNVTTPVPATMVKVSEPLVPAVAPVIVIFWLLVVIVGVAPVAIVSAPVILRFPPLACRLIVLLLSVTL